VVAAWEVSWKEKQRCYYRYRVAETFYRTPAAIDGVLAAHGLTTEFVDVDGWRPSRKLAERLGLSTSSRLVRSWSMNCGGDVGLATRRGTH
jgi:hypothetical protein